jgi:hypothetical protein
MKKKGLVFGVLLGVLSTVPSDGSGHNAVYLAYSLASLLNSPAGNKYALANQLWAVNGDLLVGQLGTEPLRRMKDGNPSITSFLQERYDGATVTLEDQHAWPSHLEGPEELEGATGVQFVNWVYRIDKPATPVRHEIFAAIVRRTELQTPGPVDTVHTVQYRFLSVRLLTLPPG